MTSIARTRGLRVTYRIIPSSEASDAVEDEEILISHRVCEWIERARARIARARGEEDEGLLSVLDRRKVGVVLYSPNQVESGLDGIGGRDKVAKLDRVVCWARVEEDDEEEQGMNITIPTSLARAYPHLFPSSPSESSPELPSIEPGLLLRPSNPLPLHTLFLRARSSSAYALAQAKPDEVLERLAEAGKVVRQGGEASFALSSTRNGEPEGMNGHPSVDRIVGDAGGANGRGDEDVKRGRLAGRGFRYAYSVLLSEPVLQGLITPQSKLYVLPPLDEDGGEEVEGEVEEEDEDETPTQSIYRTPSEGSSRSGRGSRSASVSSSRSWREKVNGFDHHADGDLVWNGKTDDEDGEAEEEDVPEIDASFLAHSLPPLPGPPPQPDGRLTLSASITSIASFTSSVPREFQPLPIPWTLSCSQGEPSEVSERIYMRPADLARCGIFSGDWVLVRPASATSASSASPASTARLARAFASDRVPPPSHGLATLLASPILLHSFPPAHPLDPPPLLQVLPTPFQAHPPPLPTAQSVTLARIASPQSTSKRFQPLFLRALRKHFERGRRVVREGEIMGVVVREADRALVRENDEGELDDELLDYEYPFSRSPPDTPIFFKITHIAYSPPPSNAFPLPQTDTYAAAALGELGCWFDPSKTRMVQSGLEHSLVPDLLLPVPKPALSEEPDEPYGKLLRLAAACLSPQAMEYGLQLCVLLRGQRGVGKGTTAVAVARKLGMHVLEVNCYDLVGESDTKTEGTLRARFEGAAASAPCIFILRNLEALARTSQVLEQGKEPAIATVLRDCISDLQAAWRTSQYPIILIATSAEADKIPLSVQACFKHEITFESPAEAERLEILQALTEGDNLAPDVSLRDVASQSAALVAKDLVDLVERARLGAVERATKELQEMDARAEDIDDAGLAISGADFTAALAQSRASYSESIGAPKIPNVSWDDVGGLAEVKADILDTIQLPLEHPELFAEGLKKRSGILLYGPPGTGKTLLAKAVATSCSLNFFSVKGPELLNMYIGESEANVRRVFQRARDARPCVIFFDELDSVAPKRGNHGDSGGVMDRIVSQLLAELDGMSDGSNSAEVFVIGATNRPDLLDPALLRPGRFDRMLYLGVSTTHEAQLKILQALTRKFRLDPNLDLMRVAQQCPFNYTGADFYALCSDAMLKAMTRKAEEIDAKIAEWNSAGPRYGHPYPMTPQYYLAELARPEETEFLVSQIDFEAALAELVPSVTASEMEHYAAVQKKFARDTINSEANIDKKGKGKGKAKAIDLPEDDGFGEQARLADELHHA